MQLIAAKIGERRAQLGLSLRQAADLAGVSHGYIEKLEKGKSTRPGLDKLSKVIYALGLPLEELTGLSNEGARALIPEVEQFTRSIAMLPFDYQRQVIEQANVFARMKFFEWQQIEEAGEPRILGKPQEKGDSE